MSTYSLAFVLMVAVLVSCVFMGQAEAESEDPSCSQKLSMSMLLGGKIKMMRRLFPHDTSLSSMNRMMCVMDKYKDMRVMDEPEQMSGAFQILAEVLKMQMGK